MKKSLILAFTLLFCVVLTTTTGCASNEKRTSLIDQIMEIEHSDGYSIISINGYTKDKKQVKFSEMLSDKMKEDNVKDEKDNVASEFQYYYDDYVFFSKAIKSKPEEIEMVLGYVDLRDLSIHTFYSSDEDGYLKPSYSNNGYVAFSHSIPTFDIIDLENEKLIKDQSDLTLYGLEIEVDKSLYQENNKDYQISNDQSSLIEQGTQKVVKKFNYEYVLSKSPEMVKIDEIVNGTKRTTEIKLYVSGGELFVVVQSQYTMFGRGTLVPVVFKYTVETEKFEYIGASAFHEFLAVSKL